MGSIHRPERWPEFARVWRARATEADWTAIGMAPDTPDAGLLEPIADLCDSHWDYWDWCGCLACEIWNSAVHDYDLDVVVGNGNQEKS